MGLEWLLMLPLSWFVFFLIGSKGDIKESFKGTGMIVGGIMLFALAAFILQRLLGVR